VDGSRSRTARGSQSVLYQSFPLLSPDYQAVVVAACKVGRTVLNCFKNPPLGQVASPGPRGRPEPEVSFGLSVPESPN
jgi:hypothetical protein